MAFEVLGTTGEVLLSDSVPAVVFWGKVTTNSFGAFTTNAPLATEQIVLPGKVIPPEDNMWSWAYIQLTDPQTVAFNNITDKFVGGEII